MIRTKLGLDLIGKIVKLSEAHKNSIKDFKNPEENVFDILSTVNKFEDLLIIAPSHETGKISFIPYIPYSDDTVFTFDNSEIIHVCTPVQEIADKYIEITSGLSLPTPRLIK